MLPLVSIVMPSLNQAAFIPAVVASVLSQSYPQIELMAYGQGEHIDANGAVLGLYPTLAPPVVPSQFANGCFICQPTVMLEGMQLLARHLGHAPKEWLLTYVNELLALSPGQRNVGDLKTHIDETLTEAKPWLQAADFQVLEGELGGLALGE